MIFSNIPILSMVLQSGLFARFILLILLGFSLTSWTIIITKSIQNLKQKRASARFLSVFRNADNLLSWSQSAQPSGKSALERLATTASQQYLRLEEHFAGLGPSQQASLAFTTHAAGLQGVMENSVANEVENSDWGQTFLAVSASVCPFVGLLGTVWGITHSFYEIGSVGSTSINIVAPGIAEALITTICGLVVAIPCALFYNLFAKDLRRLETVLIGFSTDAISEVKELLLKKISP